MRGTARHAVDYAVRLYATQQHYNRQTPPSRENKGSGEHNGRRAGCRTAVGSLAVDLPETPPQAPPLTVLNGPYWTLPPSESE